MHLFQLSTQAGQTGSSPYERQDMTPHPLSPKTLLFETVRLLTICTGYYFSPCCLGQSYKELASSRDQHVHSQLAAFPLL